MSSGEALPDTAAVPEPRRHGQRRPLFLTLWYASLFVAGSLAIVLLTYFLTSASLRARDQQIIQAKVGEYAAVYQRGGLRALAATVQAEQRTAPERLFVRVIDGGTEAIVLSDQGDWDVRSLETASLRLRDGTIVQVGKSTEARRDILSRFRTTLGFVTLSIVAIALTGGWIATESALQPIRRLTAVVRQVIRTGRTDARVPVGQSDDALDELSGLFNVMLDRVEGLVTGMRGALDNVAHDLRTPLARVRGTAEMALAGPADAARYRDALADCVDETDRVLVMLNTLMDISEAESGAMPLSREPLRLAAVAERAVELYRDVADSKGLTLEISASPDVVVLADRVRLEQAAANLLDNAVKYTPPSGRIVVEVAADAQWGVLRVRDTGPGIPAADLPRIWERSFRGDTARSTRGLGLGLSLVKAIVEAHGGNVQAASEPGRGATLTIALPLSAL
jgi:signal transduction histidine kinase